MLSKAFIIPFPQIYSLWWIKNTLMVHAFNTDMLLLEQIGI
jgi:hypothetical protein